MVYLHVNIIANIFIKEYTNKKSSYMIVTINLKFGALGTIIEFELL